MDPLKSFESTKVTVKTYTCSLKDMMLLPEQLEILKWFAQTKSKFCIHYYPLYQICDIDKETYTKLTSFFNENCSTYKRLKTILSLDPNLKLRQAAYQIYKLTENAKQEYLQRSLLLQAIQCPAADFICPRELKPIVKFSNQNKELVTFYIYQKGKRAVYLFILLCRSLTRGRTIYQKPDLFEPSLNEKDKVWEDLQLWEKFYDFIWTLKARMDRFFIVEFGRPKVEKGAKQRRTFTKVMSHKKMRDFFVEVANPVGKKFTDILDLCLDIEAFGKFIGAFFNYIVQNCVGMKRIRDNPIYYCEKSNLRE